MAKFSGGVAISLRRASLESTPAIVITAPSIRASENELPTALSTMRYSFAP
jgi:hypothetical protein